MLFRVFLLLVFALASASPEDQFKDGITAFQKGDEKAARAAFQSVLQIDERNLIALHNLALTESKAGRHGVAIALWRKALAIRPGFDQAEQAIAWSRTKLQHQEIPHEVELWEGFRNAALAGIPFENYLLMTAVLMLASGWLLLRYFGLRRQAQLDEKPLPKFPSVGFICAGLFCGAVFLSAAKAYDEAVLRGTIVAKKIESRSSPDPAATPLFDLYEGLEVIVRQRMGEWTQITYPGGSTGWIPSASILATNDKVVP